MGGEILSEIKKDYILSKLRDGERIDGRRFDEYRTIKIETGVIPRAEGSALVKIGNTQVLVGIKMQIGEPYPDTPDKGIMITNAELVPLASPTFEPGPPNENAIELARVVDRGIRESEAIALNKLCIEEGEKVWLVFIDIHVLDDDGNLVDASALAAISALWTTTVPAEKFEVGEDYSLPMQDMPIAVTSLIVNNRILVDPSRDELSVGENLVTMTSNKDESIVAIQKSGGFILAEDKFYELVDLSIKKGKEIRKIIVDKIGVEL